MGGFYGACLRQRRRRTQAERVTDRQERRKRDGTQPGKPHVVDPALAGSARQTEGPRTRTWKGRNLLPAGAPQAGVRVAPRPRSTGDEMIYGVFPWLRENAPHRPVGSKSDPGSLSGKASPLCPGRLTVTGRCDKAHPSECLAHNRQEYPTHETQ
jgi:hypothetical protein